jgi:penicillin G amidase
MHLKRRKAQKAALALAAAFFISASLSASAATPVQRYLVPGLKQPAEILVDKWGVPHIYAKSLDDVFFVQGYNAARDRLFQIDLWRRRGLGRLAEVFGPAYLEQDRATRLFLYRGDMYREWLAYGNDTKRITSAFVAGVNAYVEQVKANPAQLPMEFKLLGYQPATWQAEDVLRIRSHGLTRNLTSEVARAKVACVGSVKDDVIRFGLQPPWETKIPEGLDPCLPKDVLKVFTLATQNVRVNKEAIKTGDSAGTLIAAADNPLEVTEGSNNWTIGPAKSATGRPILANDPHRGYSTPSLRYIAHLSAPGLNVIGAGEPALPGISIGHNGTIAFGLTIFNIDQEDLYTYELNPQNADEYRYQGHWEPMSVVHESAQVKGQPPASLELKFTRHGPVIYVDAEQHRAYAVRSAWMEPGMAPYLGSIDYMRALNWDQFLAAMNRWGAPTENQVYADKSGNIGWIPGGLAPKRPNWDGLLPVPGDGRYEWAGFWDRDQLPSAYNPAQGWITTSNELNLPPDYPYKERKLGFEWTNGSRHARLTELMTQKPRISVEDSMRMQNDYLSIPARRLCALLRPLTGTDAKTQAALALFRQWDYVESADSAAAALMEVWIARHLDKAFTHAVLAKAPADAIGSPDMAVMLDMLENPATLYADATGNASSRDKVLLGSLGDAYGEMENLQGSDAAAWQWGKLHYNQPPHALADAVDASTRALFTVGPRPTGGSAYTPNQSAYRVNDFLRTNGPSFRLVVDIGNWDNSRAVNMPGQSGDPASPHYRDLEPLWTHGDYFPLLYSRGKIEKATELKIELTPGNPPAQ